MSSWKRIEVAFGHRRCGDEVQRAELISWIRTQTTNCYGDEQPLSRAMKRKIGLTLKALFDAVVEQDIILKSPLRIGGKDIPSQGKTEHRYLRIHEVDALIDATPHLSQPSYYAYRCGQVPVQTRPKPQPPRRPCRRRTALGLGRRSREQTTRRLAPPRRTRQRLD